MATNVPWGKIQYYLQNNEKSFDEEFKLWLSSNNENRKLWEELQVTYSVFGELPEEYNPNKKQGWTRVEKRIEVRGKRIRVNQFMLRIAASILLVLAGGGISWLIMNQSLQPVYTEIYSPFGHKTQVILPDSSQVWLNGNTHLKYETSFAHSRNLELNGEALFNVTKNKNKVFSVKSGELTVEVYGTAFNFKHYDREQEAEVALIEGSVGLFSKDQFLTQMSPGEIAEYNVETRKTKLSQGDIAQIISWSTDELIINNETFNNVMTYLERWYGVEISIDKDVSIDQKLSFKVKTESLQELLSIIDHIAPINYKIDGKQVKISKKM
ncbi:FecR domain-containing protein [uncultured Sunxiuqinia sp.]|uniref:FecR family protein n=1 Tax=uncultured Sunxiuqinia sp. TaxID=1573825 RepID=UPI002AA912FE|nr:FecR domain-containing protein [uncultured Sunxiuqinia sp.]